MAVMTKARKNQLKKATARRSALLTLRQYIDQEYMDADGYAVIDIALYDGFARYNPLSLGRQLDLNEEIYDFIERKASIIPAQLPLKLCFHGGNLDAAEQERVRQLLTEHYTVCLHDKLWDKRSNRRKLVGMSAVGLFFLSLYFYFALKREDGLFLEILSVIGSFALWEAADSLMLERRDINAEIRSIAQHLTQEVVFAAK